MVGKTFTCTRMGLNCDVVETEVDIKRGLPSIMVTGLLSQEVKEARERIRPAIQNSGIEFPLKRITINLSPAEIVKTGSHYDLAIAMSVLNALEIVKDTTKYAFFGELNLSGDIKWIRGLFPMVIEAINKGFDKIFIPYDNYVEFAFMKSNKIIPVKNLVEVVNIIDNNCMYLDKIDIEDDGYLLPPDVQLDYADIKGQPELIDAFTIAAAGLHHAIIVGPPGSGKTMGASRLPTILPGLTDEEFLEINKIYSVAAIQISSSSKIRPFRMPHNSFSSRAVIGGGTKVLPGEVSLAHKGVLFLDEFLEFHSDTLQSLRTIIENKSVYISLRNGCAVYPADFLLIAACNPCPCGQYGSKHGICICNNHEVKKYRRKLNNPLVDRIDLQIKVDRLNYKELSSGAKNKTSAEIRDIVLNVRNIQEKRFINEKFKLNSQIPPSKISEYCKMEQGGNKILERYMDDNILTARSCHKIMKISRTIADINGHDIISCEDINKAIEYRFLDKEHF